MKMTYKLPEDHKRMWIEALRSGTYPQTTRNLRDDVGFCCLGVMCDLARKEDESNGRWRLHSDEDGQLKHFYTFEGPRADGTTLPPFNVSRWFFGLNDLDSLDPDNYDQIDFVVNPLIYSETALIEAASFFDSDSGKWWTPIAALNDNGYTFDQIADLVEEQL